MALRGLRRSRPGVALIDVSHFDRACGHLLHVLGKRLDLGAIALIGGVTRSASRCPSVSTAM